MDFSDKIDAQPVVSSGKSWIRARFLDFFELMGRLVRAGRGCERRA
jgi:hypothetical protein